MEQRAGQDQCNAGKRRAAHRPGDGRRESGEGAVELDWVMLCSSWTAQGHQGAWARKRGLSSWPGRAVPLCRPGAVRCCWRWGCKGVASGQGRPALALGAGCFLTLAAAKHRRVERLPAAASRSSPPHVVRPSDSAGRRRRTLQHSAALQPCSRASDSDSEGARVQRQRSDDDARASSSWTLDGLPDATTRTARLGYAGTARSTSIPPPRTARPRAISW